MGIASTCGVSSTTHQFVLPPTATHFSTQCWCCCPLSHWCVEVERNSLPESIWGGLVRYQLKLCTANRGLQNSLWNIFGLQKCTFFWVASPELLPPPPKTTSALSKMPQHMRTQKGSLCPHYLSFKVKAKKWARDEKASQPVKKGTLPVCLNLLKCTTPACPMHLAPDLQICHLKETVTSKRQ